MARYAIHDGNLYRTMGEWLFLKCVPHEEGNYIPREMHEGIYGAYIGTNALVQKIMRYLLLANNMRRRKGDGTSLQQMPNIFERPSRALK